MRIWIIAGLFTIFSTQCAAQQQRALVIGIDTYAPPDGVTPSNDGGRIDFQNLEGCKNDAQSVKQLITRYNFSEKDIIEIYDRDATRDNILSGLNTLLSKSNAGDIALFYYAGHGSQMRNTKSKEADQKDESIVPSDTWKAGVSDIRDKELAIIFNSFIDKGVKLTVILDCCHSGSLSRGAPEYSKLKPRYIAESNFDVKDASAPTPPEKRAKSNFLILSASQDNEFAQEQYDNNNQPHGAFTLALLTAVQQQTVDIPVMNLFQSIREILKVNGKRQEPVIAGSPERMQQNIFGVPAAKLSDDLVMTVAPLPNGNIKVRGGYAFGLHPDNELTKVNDTSIKIKIKTVLNVSESEAVPLRGDVSKLEAGSLFRVSNWVSNTGPLLKLYLPSPVSSKEALQFATVNAEVRKSGKVQWVQKFDEVDPDVNIYYSNGKWIANSKQSGVRELKSFTTSEILSVAGGKKVNIELPPTKEMADAINKKFSDYRNMKVVAEASQANYIVYGTIDQLNQLAYGLKRSEIRIKDSLESLPLRTRAVTLAGDPENADNQVADSLFDFSLKLAKIRGWLSLAAPQKASFFPYHLELYDKANKKIIDSVGDRIGDELSLHLVANENYLNKAIPQKYIYAFTIDRDGTMNLLFPDVNDGNQGNKFPVRDDAGKLPRDFTLLDGLQIVEPVGTDSYFLLATESPLDNYAVLFQQEGVRGATEQTGSGNPMEDIITMGNARSRSGSAPTPANWALIRLSVKTRH